MKSSIKKTSNEAFRKQPKSFHSHLGATPAENATADRALLGGRCKLSLSSHHNHGLLLSLKAAGNNRAVFIFGSLVNVAFNSRFFFGRSSLRKRS